MKVSIFIPTYNSGEILRETLDSVLAQTHRDIEVLCVDDSSTDGITQNILREYEAKDSRMHVFVKPNEGDVPHSWNYIFPHLTGEFTFYMSHDDLLEPHAIEKMVKVAETDDEIDCVLVEMRLFGHDFSNPESCYKIENDIHYRNKLTDVISGEKAFELALNYNLPGFSLWRTELIRTVGMPTDTYNSDDLMHRLWKLECSKVAQSDAVFGYRQDPNSITKLYKPYNYKGLIVLATLAKMLDEVDFISEESKNEAIYQFFKYFRTYAAFFAHNRKRYNKEEKSLIKKYLRESYDIIAPRVTTFPNGVKGYLIRLEAKRFWLLMIISKIEKS